MARIKINQDKCKSCMLCVSACPNGLILRSGKLNKRGIHPVEFSLSASAKGRSASGGKGRSQPKTDLSPRLEPETGVSVGKDNSKCTGCSMCAIVCPDVCIEVYK